MANHALYPIDEVGRQHLADQLTQKGLTPTQSRRRMDKDKIEQMTDDMLNGRFDWNASALEPILLSLSNEVYGGHHRLIAGELAGLDLLSMPGQTVRLGSTSGVRPHFSWIDVLPPV